jgi:hypothetical protein
LVSSDMANYEQAMMREIGLQELDRLIKTDWTI